MTASTYVNTGTMTAVVKRSTHQYKVGTKQLVFGYRLWWAQKERWSLSLGFSSFLSLVLGFPKSAPFSIISMFSDLPTFFFLGTTGLCGSDKLVSTPLNVRFWHADMAAEAWVNSTTYHPRAFLVAWWRLGHSRYLWQPWTTC